MPLRQSVAEKTDQMASSETSSDDIAIQAFSEALQYALVLAKNRNGPRLAQLACTTFGMGLCPINAATVFRQENYFDLQALYEIFSWNPQPWSLPVGS